MLIKLSFTSETPIYQQIRDQVIVAMAKGELLPGEDLPTVRKLAKDLGINPMTVNKAYGELKDKGFILIDRRHGAKVQSREILRKRNTEHLHNALEIILSEAMLKGMKKEELIKMIERMYQ